MSADLTVWVLKSCDTCRKALKWLDETNIAHVPRDVRADGLDEATARRIVAAAGVEKAINRRSTTWRNLPDDVKDSLDEQSAVALLVSEPTLLKRPVFIRENHVLVGFDDSVRAALTG